MGARLHAGSCKPMSMVGRMDGAFFVSRSELLAWVNHVLDLSLAKVEQCSNGAVYCQIIDACHPGMVQMKRVNWSARDEHQCVPNYKVLQQGFDKVGIQRHIEVNKLVRGKYQDNLEMLQWIKTYHDRFGQAEDYDSSQRRFGDSLPEWARCGGASTEAAPGPARPASAQQPGGFAPASRGGGGPSRAPRSPNPPTRVALGAGARGGTGSPGQKAVLVREEQERRDEQERQLREEVVDLKIMVDGLETERDFYFQKLRDIEILCQALEAQPDPNMTTDQFVGNVQRILYAKDDDDEDDEDSAEDDLVPTL